MVAVQNHDQVGNRARGDRLAGLLSPPQQRLAAALVLLSPYVPLLFMGEEYGETNPFHYFVDHGDDQLITAVRDGRRREFESFGWHGDVPDPQDPSTFHRSKLDWSRMTQEPNAQLFALYRDLLTLRRDELLMRPGRCRIAVANGDPGWITLLREPADDAGGQREMLLALFNCSDSVVDVPIPGSPARAWSMRLSTEAAGYGGAGELASSVEGISTETGGPKRLMQGAERTLSLPPWTAALLSSSSH